MKYALSEYPDTEKWTGHSVNVFSLPANYYRILIQEFRAGRLDIIGCDAPAWFELERPERNRPEPIMSHTYDKGYVH